MILEAVNYESPEAYIPFNVSLGTSSLVETIMYGSGHIYTRLSISTKYNPQTASDCTHPSVS